eukprot:2424100-Amphidinium_carterae.1
MAEKTHAYTRLKPGHSPASTASKRQTSEAAGSHISFEPRSDSPHAPKTGRNEVSCKKQRQTGDRLKLLNLREVDAAVQDALKWSNI